MKKIFTAIVGWMTRSKARWFISAAATWIIIGIGLTLVVGSFNALAFNYSAENARKLTFCVAGVAPTLTFWNSGGFRAKHIAWGPPEFQMTATYVTWPGGSAGVLTNSRHVCTVEEAKALGN